MKDIPVWEKVCLTIEEAAAYSNIGIGKLTELSGKPNCRFVLYVGQRKRLIKRKAFEDWLAKQIEL